MTDERIERRALARRHDDLSRVEWLRQNTEDLRALQKKLDEVIADKNKLMNKQDSTLMRLEIIAEALGIDEHGRLVRGGIAETFSKFHGIKIAIAWAAGGIIAAMGLYSTVKEAVTLWLGK